MTEGQVISGVIQLVSVLVGAGAGSYFGLKASLNGIRKNTEKTRDGVGELCTKVNHVDWTLTEHRKETQRYVQELKDQK